MVSSIITILFFNYLLSDFGTQSHGNTKNNDAAIAQRTLDHVKRDVEEKGIVKRAILYALVPTIALGRSIKRHLGHRPSRPSAQRGILDGWTSYGGPGRRRRRSINAR